MKQAPTDPWAQRFDALASVAWAVVVLVTTFVWARVVREYLAGRGVGATTR